MATTMTITEGFQAFGLADTKSLPLSGSAGLTISESVPASTSNHPVVATIDISAIKGLYIIADANLTLETNSGSSPIDTIALIANQPLIWYTGSYFANPFSADITGLFFTNGTAAAVNVQVHVITDATP